MDLNTKNKIDKKRFYERFLTFSIDKNFHENPEYYFQKYKVEQIQAWQKFGTKDTNIIPCLCAHRHKTTLVFLYLES